MPQSSKAEELLQEVNSLQITDDFNYSYLTGGMPGTYTIIRRNTTDPYKSSPMMQIMMIKSPKFLDPDKVMRKLCEFIAEEEYYNE